MLLPASESGLNWRWLRGKGAGSGYSWRRQGPVKTQSVQQAVGRCGRPFRRGGPAALFLRHPCPGEAPCGVAAIEVDLSLRALSGETTSAHIVQGAGRRAGLAEFGQDMVGPKGHGSGVNEGKGPVKEDASPGLTASGGPGWMSFMRTAWMVGLLGVALVAGGCVGTLDGRRQAGVPFVKDRVEGRYERPVERVYAAAREVIRFNGTLVRESTQHGETSTVRILEGKVNQRTVWVRVEPVDPKVTSVVVQVRTPAGGKDLDLAHEIEKQIALQLTR